MEGPFPNMPIRLIGDLVCKWMVAGMDSSTTSNENRRPKIKNATMAKLWVSG